MRVVFLGTGGSWPSPSRNVTSIAVQLGSEVLLFDCGEGTQRQLMRSPLSFMDVRRILLSHFHGDHFLGLPGLLQTMGMNGRTAPLEVLGPAGTKEVVGILSRIGYNLIGFPLTVRELADGDRMDFGTYAVAAAAVDHPVPCLAFALEEPMRPGRFDVAKAAALGIPPGPLFGKLQGGEPVSLGGRTIRPEEVLGPPRRGRKIVFSGDCKPCEGIRRLAAGCDLLIHDATVESSLEELGNAYGHSSARQAATIAKEAGAKRLCLTHISARYEDPGPLEAEARAIFPDSLVAEDFAELEVPLPE